MAQETVETRPAPAADGASNRRWSYELNELQTRTRKLRLNSGSTALLVADLLEDALSLCGTLIQELAGAQLLNRRAQADIRRYSDSWDYLFDSVPVPCVVTDAAATIISANRSAALFLNTSAKHLVGRLLLHFSDDRKKFSASLLAVEANRTRIEELMTIRPKERAPREMMVVVLPESPEADGRYLWFLLPAPQPARGITPCA